ncbi:hypothetical protein Hanom_Chr13g01205391 [Helianthus anomalus]
MMTLDSDSATMSGCGGDFELGMVLRLAAEVVLRILAQNRKRCQHNTPIWSRRIFGQYLVDTCIIDMVDQCNTSKLSTEQSKGEFTLSKRHGIPKGWEWVVRYSWSLHREARSLWDMAVCAMLKTLLYFVLNTYIGFYNYASAKDLITF